VTLVGVRLTLERYFLPNWKKYYEDEGLKKRMMKNTIDLFTENDPKFDVENGYEVMNIPEKFFLCDFENALELFNKTNSFEIRERHLEDAIVEYKNEFKQLQTENRELSDEKENLYQQIRNFKKKEIEWNAKIVKRNQKHQEEMQELRKKVGVFKEYFSISTVNKAIQTDSVKVTENTRNSPQKTLKDKLSTKSE
jgi:regulator of replication initiation timing